MLKKSEYTSHFQIEIQWNLLKSFPISEARMISSKIFPHDKYILCCLTVSHLKDFPPKKQKSSRLTELFSPTEYIFHIKILISRLLTL